MLYVGRYIDNFPNRNNNHYNYIKKEFKLSSYFSLHSVIASNKAGMLIWYNTFYFEKEHFFSSNLVGIEMAFIQTTF